MLRSWLHGSRDDNGTNFGEEVAVNCCCFGHCARHNSSLVSRLRGKSDLLGSACPKVRKVGAAHMLSSLLHSVRAAEIMYSWCTNFVPERRHSQMSRATSELLHFI